MIRIDKVKVKGDRVYLEYSEATDAGRNLFSMDCYERAQPELYKQLALLADHIVEMLNLPDKYADGMEIRVASFDYVDQDKGGPVMGAVITALKKLENGKYFLINTPHAQAIPFGNSTNYDGCLSSACTEVLERVQDAAREYLAGKRAQTSLFDAAAAPAPASKVAGTLKR
jgi:hypothetical protein